MKTVATQFGKSFSADFETLEWTFQLDDKMKVRSGEFAIVDKPVYDEMIECLKVLYTENMMTAEIAERCRSVVNKANNDEK